MKFHKPLVNAIVAALHQVFEEGYYADKVVEHTLKQNTRWGSRDRRFIAESIYEMVRWWRLIVQTAVESKTTVAENYYHLFAVWQLLKENALPDWEEFSGINAAEISTVSRQLKKTRKFREAYADWMDELLSKELGEQIWEKESAFLNKEANVVLRVNTLKTSPEKLQSLLTKQDVQVKKENWNNLQNALVLAKRKNIQTLPEYKNGLFEIQDASSQLIAPFLNPQAGSCVIDACAGAGGKALHLAAIMNNKGKIIAMDVEENKLLELKKRSERAGVGIITTQKITDNTINGYKNVADFLLMDVPCSGLGTIRRNPDAKWKLSLDFIEKIKIKQQEILRTYAPMLKPKGTMVYATCSILPSENEKQVQLFMKENAGLFEFIEDVKILPSQGYDGFYMAKFRKK